RTAKQTRNLERHEGAVGREAEMQLVLKWPRPCTKNQLPTRRRILVAKRDRNRTHNGSGVSHLNGADDGRPPDVSGARVRAVVDEHNGLHGEASPIATIAI